MQSLTAHFREVDAHDRLPFHPSCPICRQTRLTGTIAAGGIVSPRTQALLAASLLAIPAIVPAAPARAAEQDQQQEGTAPVAESAPSDSAGDPDFDPGGEATELPEVPAPVAEIEAPADVDTDDAAPVEEPPATNPDEPVVDPGDGSGAPPVEQPVAPEATTSPDTSATAPAPTPPPPDPTSGAAPAPAATPDAPAPATMPPAPRAPEADERAQRSPRHTSARPARPAGDEHRAAPAIGVTAAPPSPTRVVPAAVTTVRGDRAKLGDRTHIVLAGESLWAIAGDLLGPEATPAEVAREVHRLWQLNRDRIGTGDPDLLMTGTKLVLR
jgi:hypothetical protein